MTDELVNSGLAAGLRAFGDDPSTAEEKATREQVERWALAVGGELAKVSQIATALVREPSGSAEPTSGWREGAGDLTRVGQSSQLASGPDGDAESSTERLTLSVDGGDLGKLSLLVDRTQGAISVTIGVRDSAAEAALGLERRALEQALAGHGISLNALRIVRAEGLGTVLAPARANANQRVREDGEAVPNDSEKRRLARKLNLIG